jgi:hypothetical protein
MARGEFKNPPAQKVQLRSDVTNKAKREERSARLETRKKL